LSKEEAFAENENNKVNSNMIIFFIRI